MQIIASGFVESSSCTLINCCTIRSRAQLKQHTHTHITTQVWNAHHAALCANILFTWQLGNHTPISVNKKVNVFVGLVHIQAVAACMCAH